MPSVSFGLPRSPISVAEFTDDGGGVHVSQSQSA
jgi:hypothetical protein